MSRTRNSRSGTMDSNVDRRSIEPSTRVTRVPRYTCAIVLAAVRNIRRIWQQQSAIPCAKLLDPFSQSRERKREREREREPTRTLPISGRINPIDFNHMPAIECPPSREISIRFSYIARNIPLDLDLTADRTILRLGDTLLRFQCLLTSSVEFN